MGKAAKRVIPILEKVEKVAAEFASRREADREAQYKNFDALYARMAHELSHLLKARRRPRRQAFPLADREAELARLITTTPAVCNWHVFVKFRLSNSIWGLRLRELD